MSGRSRNGCLDCKKAKVKCDEERPFCGTCKRRGRQCSGYVPTSKDQSSIEGARSRNNSTPGTGYLVESSTSPDAHHGLSEAQGSNASLRVAQKFSPTLSETSGASFSLPPASNALVQTLRLLKSVAPIPAGTINPTDEPFIEVYFMRHPGELVFGAEFVDEMNASVFKVFENSPLVVGDSLSAIGEAYVKDFSLPVLVPVPNRKARILARLRDMDSLGLRVELLVVIMLGLCAIELVDMRDDLRGVTILPSLLDNLAMMLDHRLSGGSELTQLAKYFVRALARQDMMLSLTKFHRPRIPVSYWLDDSARRRADRFMGYTATMMPLLAELSALAEDVKALESVTASSQIDPACMPPFGPDELLDRAAQLQSDLESWHPTLDPTLSFQSSRKFLMHATAYRSAGLLYLYRLFHPPGSSVQADQTALVMAYEIMVHTTSNVEDLKMSLWPVFLAACEATSEEDRLTAAQILDSICRGRRTITAMRTKSFIVNRVWHARDSGLDWNWMSLSLRYPDELLPI